MPTVYRAQCESCKGAPEPNGSVAGFVSIDGRNDGVVLPDSYLAVQLSDGELACLPHPIEESTLKQHGLTWRQVSKEGRLFRVEFKICKKCGTLHEERQVHDGRAGCLPALFGCVAIALLLRFLAHASWPSSLFGGYLGLFAVWLAASLLVRIRWRKRNVEARLKLCIRCQGKEFITIAKTAGRPTMCPLCGKHSMSYNRAGIS